MTQPETTWIDVLNAASNFVIAVTAVVAAWFGLRQWRRETVGRSRYELARRLALLAFRFRQQVNDFRNPFTFAGESADRTLSDDETPDQTLQRNEEYAKWSRLKPTNETILELREATWEANMLLGRDIDSAVSPLFDVYSDLVNAVRVYYSSMPTLPDDAYKELHSRLYGVPGDEFGHRVDKLVTELTEKLKLYTR